MVPTVLPVLAPFKSFVRDKWRRLVGDRSWMSVNSRLVILAIELSG